MRKMKDSGIEWIGEISTHWSTAKLKYLTNVRNEIDYSDLIQHYILD